MKDLIISTTQLEQEPPGPPWLNRWEVYPKLYSRSNKLPATSQPSCSQNLTWFFQQEGEKKCSSISFSQSFVLSNFSLPYNGLSPRLCLPASQKCTCSRAAWSRGPQSVIGSWILMDSASRSDKWSSSTLEKEREQLARPVPAKPEPAPSVSEINLSLSLSLSVITASIFFFF